MAAGAAGAVGAGGGAGAAVAAAAGARRRRARGGGGRGRGRGRGALLGLGLALVDAAAMLGLALVLAQQPGGPEPPRAAPPPPPPAPPRQLPPVTLCEGLRKKDCKQKAGCVQAAKGCRRTYENGADCEAIPKNKPKGWKKWCKLAGCVVDVDDYDYGDYTAAAPDAVDYGDYSASAEDADTVAQTRIGRGLLKKKKKSCLFPKAPEDPRRLPTVTYCEGLPKKVCNKKPGCINVKGHGCQRTYENGANCEAIPKKKKKWCRNAGCVVEVAYEYDYDYGDYDYSLKKTKFCTYPLV